MEKQVLQFLTFVLSGASLYLYIFDNDGPSGNLVYEAVKFAFLTSCIFLVEWIFSKKPIDVDNGGGDSDDSDGKNNGGPDCYNGA